MKWTDWPEGMLTVPGLRNGGNLCYLNSTIQALASCATFIETLQSCLDPTAAAASSGLSPNDGISASLIKLLTDLQPLTNQTSSKSCQVLLRSLRAVIGNDILPRREEHDAAEGIQILLHCLQAEIEANFRATQQNTLILENGILALLYPETQQEDLVLRAWRVRRLCCEGTLATHMRCLQCRHYFTSQHAPFTLLTLEIPTSKGSNLLGTIEAAKGVTLENCLENMIVYEGVHGVKCPGCSLKTSLETYISSRDNSGDNKELPESLQPLQKCIEANKGPVPCGLFTPSDLAAVGVPYINRTSIVCRRTEVSRWPATLIIQLRRTVWSPTGEQVKVCGHVDFPYSWTAGNQKTYSLVAVVVHTGLSAATGHYTTYRKVYGHDHTSNKSEELLQRLSRKWQTVSDEAVASVEELEVLATHAALLFYEEEENQRNEKQKHLEYRTYS